MILSDISEAEYPEGPPSELIQGALWYWKRELPGIEVSEYSLRYYLTPSTGGAPIEIDASVSGSRFIVQVDGGASGVTVFGEYIWSEALTKTGDTGFQVIHTGLVTLKATPDSETADPRSPAKQTLDAINSVLSGRVTEGLNAFSIRGRSLTFMAPAELMEWRAVYQQLVEEETPIPRSLSILSVFKKA